MYIAATVSFIRIYAAKFSMNGKCCKKRLYTKHVHFSTGFNQKRKLHNILVIVDTSTKYA